MLEQLLNLNVEKAITNVKVLKRSFKNKEGEIIEYAQMTIVLANDYEIPVRLDKADKKMLIHAANTK